MTYSIVAGNHSGLFNVNSSGAIIAAQSLSSSAGNVYVMNISATDNGFPQLSTYQEFIIEIYPTTTTMAGVQLVHNPAVSEICHFTNSVEEMTGAIFVIASIPSVGSQHVSYLHSTLKQHRWCIPNCTLLANGKPTANTEKFSYYSIHQQRTDLSHFTCSVWKQFPSLLCHCCH